jgi:hypothetical protein
MFLLFGIGEGKKMRLKSILIVAVFFFVFSVGHATADSLYSTFGPGDGFTGTLVQWIGDGAIAGTSFIDRQVANSFAVALEAEVIDYRVAVSRFTGTPSGLGILTLWSGDSVPTDIVESGITFDTGNGTARIAVIASVLQPVLHPGVTYWLSLSAPTDELLRWYLSPNPGSSRLEWRDSTRDWSSPVDFANAFEIRGNLSSVPEPASIVLVGAGLGIVALSGWRKKMA